MAHLLGLETETICRMEKGHNSTSLKRLQQFADLYGCTVIDLLQDEAPPHQETSAFIEQLQHLSATERETLRHFLKTSILLLHD